MQQSIDHNVAAERESKLLIGVAAGLGCVLVLCLVIAVLVVFLALLWTLQGQLGPGGSSAAPTLLSLASLIG
ncbi:MAG TPA: hypothetical protein VL334_13650 [Anaerolineae bacterium]|nr:hypothetical protein [Anaerolineae bacterium]